MTSHPAPAPQVERPRGFGGMTPDILRALLSSPDQADRIRGLAVVRKAAMACGGAHGAMAEALGIAASTLHDWRKRHTGVELAIREARVAADYRRTGGPRKSTEG